VAFFIGTIEIFGLLAQEAHLDSGFWAWTQRFNINSAGFIIVGLFVVTWVMALVIWRFGRIEARWDAAADRARAGAMALE
jgi:nickel/cobalt transporter (NiCoT) family protein